jgi:hypothetical protein
MFGLLVTYSSLHRFNRVMPIKQVPFLVSEAVNIFNQSMSGVYQRWLALISHYHRFEQIIIAGFNSSLLVSCSNVCKRFCFDE